MVTEQLNLEQALAAGDAAVAAVRAQSYWWGLAYEALDAVARTGAAFTTDQIWERMALIAPGGVKPEEPRVMGAVIREAVRDGMIMATGRWVPSAQVSRHGAPVREWRITSAAYDVLARRDGRPTTKGEA